MPGKKEKPKHAKEDILLEEVTELRKEETAVKAELSVTETELETAKTAETIVHKMPFEEKPLQKETAKLPKQLVEDVLVEEIKEIKDHKEIKERWGRKHIKTLGL